MSTHAGWDHVGAEGHSYPEVAARAVAAVHQQNPSPVYGYLRAGAQQKIYLFPALHDGAGWITTLTATSPQPYDYAAVFAAADLSRPVTGLEDFGRAQASVGAWWPFILGLPAGALGGYYLRKWQEDHPGQVVPGIPRPAPVPVPPPSGEPSAKAAGDVIGGPWLDAGQDDYGPWQDDYVIGGPWLDVDGQDDYVIGGPWLDVVGAQASDREQRQTWPQTRALIQSAIREVSEAAVQAPAEAYVWSLDPPSPSPSPSITLEGTTSVVTFPSTVEALGYMRERIQTPHVALALFDRRSSHWPNPTSWTKSNLAEHEHVIAQQVARYAPSRAAGDYVGADPRASSIDTALNAVRGRARALAARREGDVVGVIHTTTDGRWHALAFRAPDDADDWLGTATQNASAYTYAAYYDKEDPLWPRPLNEKIGGGLTRVSRRAPARPAPAAADWELA